MAGNRRARNYAVAHSKSALIALLDQDDLWHPRHLEALVEVFAEHKGPPLGLGLQRTLTTSTTTEKNGQQDVR